jgi:hypothetical protein
MGLTPHISLRATLLALALAVVVGCGRGPTDTPSDCTSQERYDEARQQCEPCPAVRAPECREGCGFEIFTASDGCPAARCAPDCARCRADQFFSEDTLLCVPCPPGQRFDPGRGACRADCPDGQYFSRNAQSCVACPGAAAARDSCDDLPCSCEPVEISTCATAFCGNCTAPTGEATIDDRGLCSTGDTSP